MPRAAKDGLTKFVRSPETIQRVAAIIKRKEFYWWLNRTPRGQAITEIRAETGLRVPSRLLREFIKVGQYEAEDTLIPSSLEDIPRDTVEWYGVVRRVNPSTVYELDSRGWDNLRAAVRKCAEMIEGQGIIVAEAIVSTEFKTNRKLLEGLNRDIHVWEPKPIKAETEEEASLVTGP